MRKSTALVRNGLLLLACIVVFMIVATIIATSIS
ncbi:hypothetical protein GP2143_13651 [marine gamma proteobacterium HTCC2143]|jgi:hypothetical protein|uniref:Uncharacterized protein n=1 Tax=marine gamma proteobacterium HTCC2143 TaxID=247633 RepID=A0Y850_9GAMM|nr:hypothetical protein GP2143_13651 [marine gamma proteobacterium HTCC2143]